MIVARASRQPNGLWDFFPNGPQGDLKPTIYSDEDWVGIELTVSDPPSMEGRRVLLVLDDKDTDDLLRKLRDRAIEIRRKTMEPTK